MVICSPFLCVHATIDLQGVVASGLAFPLMSWCLRERGPLYVAMFGPLIIVFVAVLSSIFLDETLHLGMYVHGALAALASVMEIDSVWLVFSRAMWVPFFFLQRAGRRPDRGWAVHGALGQSERSAGESCGCSARR